MYDEPQVSSGGDWADATVVVDSEGRSNYSCRYCELKESKYRCRIFQKLKDHIKSCKERISKLEEGKDFVHCKICNLHAQKLATHIMKGHGMTLEEYKKKYSAPIISKISSKKYSKASSGENGTARHKSLLKKFDSQEAIKEYYSNIGKKVSATIMSSESERKRRSGLMSTIIKDLVQDPNYIKMLSEKAAETSKRPDIIENRTRQLKNWRENNRDEFHEKCIKKMIKKGQSKPEKKLIQFLKELDGFSFKGNQFLKSEIFSTKSKRKQVDVADKGRKIYVEYDGTLHFEPIFSEESLKIIQEKDMQLEKFISEKGWTLIRISCDQYVDKNKIEKSFFKQECLDKVLQILQDNKPGIYKIGNKYG